MRTVIISIMLSVLISCSPGPQDKRGGINTSDTGSSLLSKNDSFEAPDHTGELLDPVVLSESKINDIALPFPLKDMTEDLASLFHDCSIKKEVGEQDGPDFPLYSIKCAGKQIGFFAMHDTDTLTLDDIYIKDSIIADQYGLRVGDDLSSIKKNRGSGLIGFDPYHLHMYYYFADSRISYELVGRLRTFDVEDVADIVIEEKDIADWKIQYIIWR